MLDLFGIEGGSLDLRKEEVQLEFDSKKLTVEQILTAVATADRSTSLSNQFPPRAKRPKAWGARYGKSRDGLEVYGAALPTISSEKEESFHAQSMSGAC